MSYGSRNKPRDVPLDDTPSSDLRVGDSLGSFVGYLRRPKSTSAGLLAQFFGENGADADVIAALHLTRFLDATVKVTVWMMKDHSGRSMKKNGEYLRLTEFIGTIRRPLPSAMGQVAQFFGDNGANSDAINVLNQSSFLDALVYVEMHQAEMGMTVADVQTPEPADALAEHSTRMTPNEARDYKDLQKRAHEGVRVLTLSGFFRQETVLSVLGRDTDYQAWTETQWCCHPGATPCDQHPVTAWALPGSKRYARIPLCGQHAAQWNDGTAILPDGSSPLGFAQSQHIVFLQRWALDALRKQLKVGADRLPTPGAIYTWAVDHKVHNFIPGPFKAFLG